MKHNKLRLSASLHHHADRGEWWISAHSGNKCCMETAHIATGYCTSEDEAREQFRVLTQNHNLELVWREEK